MYNIISIFQEKKDFDDFYRILNIEKLQGSDYYHMVRHIDLRATFPF